MVISSSSVVSGPFLSELEAPSRNKAEMKRSPTCDLSVSHTSSSARGVSGSGLTVRDLCVWGPYVLCLLDGEAQCRAALTDWLLRYGEQTYYDRLSRALQHIGRTDIAIGETRTETPRTHEPCESTESRIVRGATEVKGFELKWFTFLCTVLLTAANVTSRHLSMSLDKRKTGTKPHSGTRRWVLKNWFISVKKTSSRL